MLIESGLRPQSLSHYEWELVYTQLTRADCVHLNQVRIRSTNGDKHGERSYSLEIDKHYNSGIFFLKKSHLCSHPLSDSSPE